jgi:hypothetical protein
MHQQRKDWEKGDITGQTAGDRPPPESEFDFPDWDNPEDFDEDAPEGYYEEDDDEEWEDEDDSYIPGPDDPDYDLSEAHGYSEWEPREGGPIPQWVLTLLAVLLILALLFPIYLSVR